MIQHYCNSIPEVERCWATQTPRCGGDCAFFAANICEAAEF